MRDGKPSQIESLVLTVLQQTPDLATIPAVQQARRYFRAFMAGENDATLVSHFKSGAMATARLSMLTLGCQLIAPHWKDGDITIAAIRDYVHVQKMERQ